MFRLPVPPPAPRGVALRVEVPARALGIGAGWLSRAALPASPAAPKPIASGTIARSSFTDEDGVVEGTVEPFDGGGAVVCEPRPHLRLVA